MARNASGTYTLPSGNPVVSGTLIDATWANNTLSDLGNEMTDSLSRSGEGAMLAPLRITDGVQATPSLAFSNEPSSGLYRAGSNEWWAVAAGVQNLRFTNTGLTTRAAAGAVGTPSIAAFNDTDTGIYFPGANELAIATGGAARMTFDAAGAVAVPGTFTLSGGTANGVLYLNGSKVATSGSALTFDGTNLGIGTASPAFRLEVAGNARILNSGADSQFIITAPTDAYAPYVRWGVSGIRDSGILGFPAGDDALVYRSQANSFSTGTERFRITVAGNVGIGTASPVAKLSVQDASVPKIALQVGGAERAFLSYTESNFTTLLDSDGPLVFAANNAEVGRFDVLGNLGIGTASPGVRLDVIGTQNVSGAASGTATGTLVVKGAQSNASGLVLTQNNSTDTASITNYYNSPLIFGTNNTERGRFTAGGYFKASNDGTYQGSTSSYHELRSTGAAGDWNTVVTNTTATGANAYGIRIAYTGSAPNGTGNAFLSCDDNASGATTRAAIRSNGGLANYQANDVNLSDERVKTDIAPLGSMWDKIKALEIVTFKYKDQTHDDDNIGLIAQQVESVAPEFVDVDGWGETPEDGVPLKSIYTADMYHAAIKALQEAMARIESLEAKVSALEAK